MKILALYDGTIQAKKALNYGLEKVREKGGELIVLQVLQSSQFIDYDAGPIAEQTVRAEAARHLHEAEAILAAEPFRSIPVRLVATEGDPVDETLAIAESEQAELILATPRYKTIGTKSARPVYIMPGTILVPRDSSDPAAPDIAAIAAEAKASGSRVLLLGIVPVHIYSRAEQEELERITVKTTASVKTLGTGLAKEGIEATELVTAGYPDEEILKAAEKCEASLIMLPSGGTTPSELAKAAAILLDEPERVGKPVYIMSHATT